MNPFGPLNPVERVWPRRPPGERRERRQEPPGTPEMEEDRDPPADEPLSERQSGDDKSPVPGRIVDDYA